MTVKKPLSLAFRDSGFDLSGKHTLNVLESTCIGWLLRRHLLRAFDCRQAPAW